VYDKAPGHPWEAGTPLAWICSTLESETKPVSVNTLSWRGSSVTPWGMAKNLVFPVSFIKLTPPLAF
jgi:hypothetical protein